MCGRFTVFNDSDIKEVEKILQDIQKKYGEENVKTGDIYPTNRAATFRAGQEGYETTLMQWGFPKWDGKGVIINARSETASVKKTFMKPLRETRCVIPTTGFYEWDADKNKYLFLHENNETNPLLYLAGIYSTFKEKDNSYDAFTIFTRNANESVQDIHHRMPVILYQREINDYLQDDDFIPFLFNRDGIMLKKIDLSSQD